MARRAKTSVQPIHILGIIAVITLASVLGYFLLGGGSGSGSFTGVAPLNLREYLENSNALSNNTYSVEGIIDERLDNWRSSEGRLFSVVADGEGGDGSPVPILVPARYNSTNIQRGQRFHFKVTVQAGTGILEVIDLSKS